MYCSIKYTDLKHIDAISYTEDVTSEVSYAPVTKHADDYIETILVNPNCYAQILIDHINKIMCFEKHESYDLCDIDGQLTGLNELPANTNATNVLEPKETYYIIRFEYAGNGTIINASPVLNINTKLYLELSVKVRKALLLSSKISLDRKSHTSFKSKNSVSTASTKSNRPRSSSMPKTKKSESLSKLSSKNSALIKKNSR